MFPWMKRGLVISSALLTISMFLPLDLARDVQAEEPQKTQAEKNEKSFIFEVNQENYDLFHAVLPVKTEHYIHRSVTSAPLLNNYILKQAYEQSIQKFGMTISSKIQHPFNETIVPRLHTAFTKTTDTLDDKDWENLKISPAPSGGFGEKIFHLYNEENGRDIFRFHVRRDQRPKQGYSFNFHYHTYLDNHEKHHEIGTIHWGKDMPPKWNSERI